ASNATRDRKNPIKAHQINLQRSLIGSEYQPIRGRGQPFWVSGRHTGILYAIPRQESSFNPRAISSARAVGLMQMTPAAGRYVAKKFGARYDEKRLALRGWLETPDRSGSTTRSEVQLGGSQRPRAGVLPKTATPPVVPCGARIVDP